MAERKDRLLENAAPRLISSDGMRRSECPLFIASPRRSRSESWLKKRNKAVHMSRSGTMVAAKQSPIPHSKSRRGGCSALRAMSRHVRFPALPQPAAEGFDVGEAEVVTDGREVDEPERELCLVLAVPGEPGLHSPAGPITEETAKELRERRTDQVENLSQ